MFVNLCKASELKKKKNNNNNKIASEITTEVGIKGRPQHEGIMPFFVNFTMLITFADAKRWLLAWSARAY